VLGELNQNKEKEINEKFNEFISMFYE